MNFGNRYLMLFIMLSLSLLLPGLSAGTEEAGKEKPRKLPLTFNAKVDYVVDGDSIRVWLVDEDALFLISIYGLDAPELRQPYGKKARDFVEKTLKNKKLKVTIVQTGQYQTGLGYFIADGEDLGTILVNSGLAEVDQKTGRQFRDKSEMKRLLELEKAAREKKVGMWVQGEDYESPLAFMIRTRKKQTRASGKH